MPLGGAFFLNVLMKLALDAKGLAMALSLPVSTVQQYASRYPDKLPPRLMLPGRKLMWSVKDVEEWIERHRTVQPEVLPPPS